MNERIRQLYYECCDESLTTEESYQKFAELIVLESIDYCGENLSKTVGAALKIHFGVDS